MAIKDRFELIREKITGVDGLVDKILTDDTPEKLVYSKAILLYTSQTKRKYVEACLLATKNTEEIAELLELDHEVVSLYSQVFYDVDGLDKLSRLELLNIADRDEAMLKCWALSQGLDFIKWRLGAAVQVDPVDGLNELFTLATYKSKEALFTGNSSDSSKEATRWVKLSMDLARLMKAWVMDSDAAQRDIQLALREIDPNFDGLEDIGDDLGIDLSLLNAPEVTLDKIPSSSD